MQMSPMRRAATMPTKRKQSRKPLSPETVPAVVTAADKVAAQVRQCQEAAESAARQPEQKARESSDGLKGELLKLIKLMEEHAATNVKEYERMQAHPRGKHVAFVYDVPDTDVEKAPRVWKKNGETGVWELDRKSKRMAEINGAFAKNARGDLPVRLPRERPDRPVRAEPRAEARPRRPPHRRRLEDRVDVAVRRTERLVEQLVRRERAAQHRPVNTRSADRDRVALGEGKADGGLCVVGVGHHDEKLRHARHRELELVAKWRGGSRRALWDVRFRCDTPEPR